MKHDVAVLIGVTEHGHLKFCRDIIVKGQARAVGKAVAVGVEAELAHKVHDDGTCLLGGGGTGTRAGSQLVEHRFGVEVVALLEHAQQHLVHGVETVADAEGVAGLYALVELGFNHDAHVVQTLHEARQEDVFSADEKG